MGKAPAESEAISLNSAIQPRHIGRNTLSDGTELDVAAGGAQFGQVGLGEALITAFQVIRERDVFDFTLAVIVDYRFGDVLERLATAGAAVEYAGFFRVAQEP